MRKAPPTVLATVLAVALLGAPGLADEALDKVLVVPTEYATIQEAVDAAEPGDTVLILPGVYREAVYVDQPEITIRGTDAASVILDGETDYPTCSTGKGVGISVYRADNVTLRSMTARNYRSYGFSWYDLHGFYGYDLVAANDCTYGILTHDSEVGEIAYSEVYGAGDGGLYTGEAADCRCDLHHNNVHDNVMGFSGTKGNHVLLRDNWFHHNGVGILPNTLTPDVEHYVLEHALPGVAQGIADPLGKDTPLQCCTVIANNLIEDNNNHDVVPHGFAETIRLPIGTGVELAGASGNIVYGNTIRGHERWGVAVHWLFVPPNGNVVHDNSFAGNAKADLWWDGWGVGNCFQHNGQVVADPDPMPECGPLPSVGVPDPRKDAELAIIALGHLVGL